MSLPRKERLYQLLPVLYRMRDAEHGEPLRALLALLEDEFDLIERDITGQYDDWFIETCAEWVVPYIGDLLGVRPLRDTGAAGISARAYVANTLAYRRRKGTAVVLEQLVRDATGWTGRAVEFFARLATTQHMNHVRLSPTATPELRSAANAELVDGAFDTFAHTLEVRRAATRGGRYNIPHVGLFIWRLCSYKLGEGQPGDELADFVSARQVGDYWAIHPLGCDSPLFNQPRTETDISHLAGEENVPDVLRWLVLNTELEQLRQWKSREKANQLRPGEAEPELRFMSQDDPVLRIWVRLAGELEAIEVQREDMYLCRLPDFAPEDPLPRALAFDPARGRLVFPEKLAVEQVLVQHSYGFSGDLGGGPYDRTASVVAANRWAEIGQSPSSGQSGFFDSHVWQVGVSHLHESPDGEKLFGSLREAVTQWNQQPPGRIGVIVLMDSLTDEKQGNPAAPLKIEIGEGSRLLIIAGAWPLDKGPGEFGSGTRRPGRFEAQRTRAHLVGDLLVYGTAPLSSTNPGTCVINGVLLEGRLCVGACQETGNLDREQLGNLGQLELAHSTLANSQGLKAVEVRGNEQLQLSLSHSICGAVIVDKPIHSLEIADSIVGGLDERDSKVSLAAPQADVTLLRSTLFGASEVQSITASDCIFDGPLRVQRHQVGCVRFSYLAPDSKAPRRYRCQPDLEIAKRLAAEPVPVDSVHVCREVEAQIQPLFVSRDYGDPGFAQLDQRCTAAFREGAESGAEMGAFEFLKQPQREANLRQVLAEYLRFGLDAGLFFVT